MTHDCSASRRRFSAVLVAASARAAGRVATLPAAGGPPHPDGIRSGAPWRGTGHDAFPAAGFIHRDVSV